MSKKTPSCGPLDLAAACASYSGFVWPAHTGILINDPLLYLVSYYPGGNLCGRRRLLSVILVHRYDEVIARQARIYRFDEKLVWSLIYEETYFRGWKIGAADEVGLMQVTPVVARDWAHETGFREFEKQASENVVEFLHDPERNIQVGCWYLEKVRERYRSYPAETAMTLAAYNAGPSRVEEWTRGQRCLGDVRAGICRAHRHSLHSQLRYIYPEPIPLTDTLDEDPHRQIRPAYFHAAY
jgi:soluble lytic murein transglycosylase-like protein